MLSITTVSSSSLATCFMFLYQPSFHKAAQASVPFNGCGGYFPVRALSGRSDEVNHIIDKSSFPSRLYRPPGWTLRPWVMAAIFEPLNSCFDSFHTPTECPSGLDIGCPTPNFSKTSYSQTIRNQDLPNAPICRDTVSGCPRGNVIVSADASDEGIS